MPATELRFGRAPGAWLFLGHVVALRVRTAMGNGLASAAHIDHRRPRLVM
jgi:hypothetical protein